MKEMVRVNTPILSKLLKQNNKKSKINEIHIAL
jgi:hypothetical protein